MRRIVSTIVASVVFLSMPALGRSATAPRAEVHVELVDAASSPSGPMPDANAQRQLEEFEKAHPAPTPLSPQMQDQMDRATEVVNDPRSAVMTDRWQHEGIRFQSMHADTLNGQVCITIEVLGHLTPAIKATMQRDFEMGNKLGGFPVHIYGVPGTGTATGE